MLPHTDAGLIGWVPNTDTLHALIREYRDARKIPLNVEHRLMLGMAPDYDNLTVIQKVEVFEHALDSTSGTSSLTPMTPVARTHWNADCPDVLMDVHEHELTPPSSRCHPLKGHLQKPISTCA